MPSTSPSGCHGRWWTLATHLPDNTTTRTQWTAQRRQRTCGSRPLPQQADVGSQLVRLLLIWVPLGLDPPRA